MPGRAGLLVLLVSTLFAAAALAGAATAHQKHHVKQHASPVGSSRAAALALVAKLRSIQHAQAAAKQKLMAQAAAKHGVATLDYPISAAVDGQQLYVLHVVLKARIHAQSGDDWFSLRSRLVRTDRLTGAHTELFSKKDVYPLGLYARGGRVAFEAAGFKVDKRSVQIVSTLFTAGASDAALTPGESRGLTIHEDDRLCGQFGLLAGVSDKGAPLVADVTGECHDLESDFTAELALLNADGTRRDLGPLSIDSTLGGGVLLTGQTLLQPSAFDDATTARNLADDSQHNLWSPGSRIADIGPDGTVALIGLPPRENHSVYYVPGASSGDGQFTGDYFSRNAGTAGKSGSGTGDSTGVILAPNEVDVSPPQPVRKYPFVLFPGGDADNPVLLSSSRSKVFGLKFCGTNLYVLEARIKGLDDSVDDAGGLGLLAGLAQPYARVDIKLYDTHGTFVRSLGTTKKLVISSTGCNGDRLVLAAFSGRSIGATEIGP